MAICKILFYGCAIHGIADGGESHELLLTCLPCLESLCQLEGAFGVSLRDDLLGLGRVRSASSSRECSRNAAVLFLDTRSHLQER
jgi:hypothetical protein